MRSSNVIHPRPPHRRHAVNHRGALFTYTYIEMAGFLRGVSWFFRGWTGESTTTNSGVQNGDDNDDNDDDDYDDDDVDGGGTEFGASLPPRHTSEWL